MIDLQPGDVFATANPMALGRAINAVQKVWSGDNESRYSHTGVIETEDGVTLEALWTVKGANLFKAYSGKPVIVARPLVPQQEKVNALEIVRRHHEGDWYPLWRLVFHMIPPVAKYASFRGRFLVCSELVGKYLYLAGARHAQFTGTTPDELVDEWRRWKSFEIIYEGVLP